MISESSELGSIKSINRNELPLLPLTWHQTPSPDPLLELQTGNRLAALERAQPDADAERNCHGQGCARF